MVNTVGRKGKPGEHVRCIVSVNMLSEGWDVQSVSHILGLRAFGSPLLTEQIVGRGLRRMNYDVLNQPIEERSEGSEETVDAFGIPFIGFPVQKRKRSKTGAWGQKPVWIEVDPKKENYRISVPNVRSWAVGITKPLHEIIDVRHLAELVLDPKETPPEVYVRPVVGGKPEVVMTLEQVRTEWPLLKTAFLVAQELYDAMSSSRDGGLEMGPTFDELVEVAKGYLEARVKPNGRHLREDVAIYFWRSKVVDRLENAIRSSGLSDVAAVPILGSPEQIDTADLRRFQWTGLVTEGRKSHLRRVACHNPLEQKFAEFLG